MKKSFFAIIFFAFVFGTSIMAQSKAVKYMEKINKELNAIMVDSWDYTSEVAHGKSARKTETKRKELVRTSKQAMERVSKMDGFEGSTQFRDSVLSYLKINYLVLNEDYEKIVNMEEIAEQSYDKMEAYLLAQELAGDKLELAGDQMEEQQKVFAANNNINLLENKDKTAKKLEKASGVIKHYNQVYLIFFKAYKQEAYLLDAIKRKDVNAMEQNKNAMASASAEGLEKLKSVGPFKNDKSLINASKGAIEFYQMEANTKISSIIDFYLQQEKFEKIKSAFESKAQSDRTKEDVKQYNDAVNDFNNRLNANNKLNTDLFNTRSTVLDKWNNSAKNFMDKHVPKYK